LLAAAVIWRRDGRHRPDHPEASRPGPGHASDFSAKSLRWTSENQAIKSIYRMSGRLLLAPSGGPYRCGRAARLLPVEQRFKGPNRRLIRRLWPMN
jgi:hypothetical protein